MEPPINADSRRSERAFHLRLSALFCGSICPYRCPLVLRAQSQRDQRERVDFARRVELPILLEPAQRIDRFLVPSAGRLSAQVAFAGQRLLDLLISLRSG